MAKHPHHALIVEWAQDTSKTIQCYDRTTKTWYDLNCTPSWHSDMKYRIKPIPKPNVTFSVKIVQKNAFPQCVWPEHWEMANCDLVFDGETGKLIKAEVLHD